MTTLMTELLKDLQKKPLPDEFGEVRVVEAHQQLCVLPNVADKVLEVHVEAVGVRGVEDWLPPEVQTLLQGLQRILYFHQIFYFPLQTKPGEFSSAAKGAQHEEGYKRHSGHSD